MLTTNELLLACLADPYIMKNNGTVDVVSADKIPSFENGLVIVNTDPSWMSGEHWVLIRKSGDTVVYFDSYGTLQGLNGTVISSNNEIFSFPQIKVWLEKCTMIDYNTKVLQSFDTTSCGDYCLYFAHYLSRNHSFVDIVFKLLTLSRKQREHTVQCQTFVKWKDNSLQCCKTFNLQRMLDKQRKM